MEKEKKIDIILAWVWVVAALVTVFGTVYLALQPKSDGCHLTLTPAQSKYTTIELADTDIVFVYLTHTVEVEDVSTNYFIHEGIEEIKYNTDFLILGNTEGDVGTIFYNMHEVVTWGIDK